ASSDRAVGKIPAQKLSEAGIQLFIDFFHACSIKASLRKNTDQKRERDDSDAGGGSFERLHAETKAVFRTRELSFSEIQSTVSVSAHHTQAQAACQGKCGFRFLGIRNTRRGNRTHS